MAVTMTKEEFMQRQIEIQTATKLYPGLEIGEAYTKWKEARGEKATWLRTDDPTIEESKTALKESAKKPCTQAGCGGTMTLEAVCGSCVEGRRGYLSKWTCEECLHRELSKKGYLEWLQELSNENYV